MPENTAQVRVYFSLTPTKTPRKVHLSAHFRNARDAPQEFSHFQFKLSKLVSVIHGGGGDYRTVENADLAQ